MKPIISIIVIVKNDPEIRTTLEAIKEQKKPGLTEVIVVDRSAKVTLQSIRQNHPEVTWLFYRAKPGKKFTFAEQRNLGLKHASGDLIVFVDCGCTLSPGWLGLLYKASQKHPIVSSALRSKSGKAVFQTGANSKDIQKVPESPTNGLAIRKEVFDAVGTFDPQLTFGEDVDFQWRARKHGYDVVRHDGAVVYHDWGGLRQDFRRSFRYGAARAKLYRKHPANWRQMLGYDAVVPAYSLFLLGLPLAIFYPAYLLVILIPFLKNLQNHPFILVATYLVYGSGVLYGAVTPGLSVRV